MNDETRFFEIGPAESPLEAYIRRYEGLPDEVPSLEILRAALRLSRGECDLVAERERIRRGPPLASRSIDALIILANEAGEESYRSDYALKEMLQPSAVANLGGAARTAISGYLAVAAKLDGRYARARQAYADVFEGLQILSRYFAVDRALTASTTDSIVAGWNSVKDNLEPPLEILDAASDRPEQEWLDLVLWNSDLNSGQGLIDQADAAVRLAVHLEHWADRQGRALAVPVERLCELGADLRAGEDSFLAARVLITIGDALMETGHWDLAAEAHRAVSPLFDAEALHPVGIHAVVQEAHCLARLGQPTAARRMLATVDRERLAQLAELVATVSGEAARLKALELSLDGPNADRVSERRRAIDELLSRASLMVTHGSNDRVSYLRNLHYSMLMKDIGLLR